MIDKGDRAGAIVPAGTRRLAVIYPPERTPSSGTENAIRLELTNFEAKVLADLLKDNTGYGSDEYMSVIFGRIAAKLGAETERVLGPEGEGEGEDPSGYVHGLEGSPEEERAYAGRRNIVKVAGFDDSKKQK